MKLKLLKDLPGFPEGTVFLLKDNYKGKAVWVWQYHSNEAMVGSNWLQDLLYGQIPEPDDDYVEFFEQIIEQPDLYYAVNFDGTIKEFSTYSWWGNPDNPNVFSDKETAQTKANQIKQIKQILKESN